MSKKSCKVSKKPIAAFKRLYESLIVPAAHDRNAQSVYIYSLCVCAQSIDKGVIHVHISNAARTNVYTTHQTLNSAVGSILPLVR